MKLKIDIKKYRKYRNKKHDINMYFLLINGIIKKKLNLFFDQINSYY